MDNLGKPRGEILASTATRWPLEYVTPNSIGTPRRRVILIYTSVPGHHPDEQLIARLIAAPPAYQLAHQHAHLIVLPKASAQLVAIYKDRPPASRADGGKLVPLRQTSKRLLVVTVPHRQQCNAFSVSHSGLTPRALTLSQMRT